MVPLLDTTKLEVHTLRLVTKLAGSPFISTFMVPFFADAQSTRLVDYQEHSQSFFPADLWCEDRAWIRVVLLRVCADVVQSCLARSTVFSTVIALNGHEELENRA